MEQEIAVLKEKVEKLKHELAWLHDIVFDLKKVVNATDPRARHCSLHPDYINLSGKRIELDN